MEGVRQLIIANSDRHPEFRYYLPIIAKACRNEVGHPDTCIECCKSLLEGVSKSVIMRLEPGAALDDVERLDVPALTKRALKLLKENDDILEDDFVNRAGSLAHALGNLRNTRSDISHGRAVPKQLASHYSFASLILPITESILKYMLASLFALCPVEENRETEALVEETSDLEQVRYEDEAEFNDYLDELNPTAGKVIYSMALYELYYEDYIIELNAYRESLEDE